MRAGIRRTRAMTDRPFGVNLVLEWDQRERVGVRRGTRGGRIDVLGRPAPYVDAIHAVGALHFHTVGSAEEACRAAKAGVDVIVAQGWEAGGRVRGQVASLPLVPAVVDAVRPVPSSRREEWPTDEDSPPSWSSEPTPDGWARGSCSRARQRPPRMAAPHPRCFRDQHLVRNRLRSRLARCAASHAAQQHPGRVGGAGRPAAPRRPGEGDVVAHAPDGTACTATAPMLP